MESGSEHLSRSDPSLRLRFNPNPQEEKFALKY
jgi:hypothetical protein